MLLMTKMLDRGRDLLLNPVDVALSPSGHRVYVADALANQVFRFSPDGALLGACERFREGA